MKSVAVYCGSRTGNIPIYTEASISLGNVIAKKDITMVYGGGKVGLMGVIADAMLEQNGNIIGVTPQFLADIEVHHKGLEHLIIVDTMAHRKTKMIELSNGFIAMPGGYGTLEEIFEVMTLSILKRHHYPVALYNVNGFYNHLISHLDQLVDQGFLEQYYRDDLIIEENPEILIDKMLSYKATDFFKY
jgi:uncharacterized protein (TIGR00730 family)